MTAPALNTLPAVGDPGTAAWADLVAGDVNFDLQKPCARLIQHTTQSIGSASFNAITFDTSSFDTASGHSISVNNSIYFAPAAGLYRVSGLVAFGANATGARAAAVYLNGVLIGDSQVTVPAVSGAGLVTGVPTSMLLRLAVSDQVQIAGYQSSGSALGTVADGSGMTIEWIRL